MSAGFPVDLGEGVVEITHVQRQDEISFPQNIRTGQGKRMRGREVESAIEVDNRRAGGIGQFHQLVKGILMPSQIVGHDDRVIALVEMGRSAEAGEAAKELRQHVPDFKLEVWARRQYYQDPERLRRDLEALQSAGLG